MRTTCYLMIFVSLLFGSLEGFSKEIIKRDILVLWSSTETRGKDYSYSTVHRNFESLWNYYGYRLNYFEANFDRERILSEINSNKYAAVITFYFDNPIKDVRQYINSLRIVKEKNIPLIVLGEWGFLNNVSKFKDEVSSFFKTLGIEYLFNSADNPLLFKIEKISKTAEFERKLENEIIEVKFFKVINKSNKSHLAIKVEGTSDQIDLIIEGDKFFFAQRGYEFFINPLSNQIQWRVDPFHIIEKIVGVPSIIPDVTTVCGRRAAFIHIDGDGFINQSHIDRNKLSGNIILEKIISQYKLPTTVSFVTAELDEKILGSKKAIKSAQDIARNPFVEIATHTFSHPLSWDMVPSQDEIESYVSDKEISRHKGPIVAYKIQGYTMDYLREIKGSSDFINDNITSKNKPVKLIQWSGNCKPPEIALKIAENEGLLNINGGDSRLDSTYPSVSGLSALYRKIGSQLQVYSAAANENIYTNLWRGPFGGFNKVIENFKNTDKQRRLKPINIYYHFYSGERESSLNSLIDIYKWVIEQKITPIFTSDYIGTVNDFIKTEIYKESEKKFRITSGGKLKTLRIDSSDTYPDYHKSKNIIGHNFINGQLYLSLGADKETILILTNEKPKNTYVSSCNSMIDQINFTEKEIEIMSGNAYVPYEIELSNGKILNGPRGRLDSKRITIDSL